MDTPQSKINEIINSSIVGDYQRGIFAVMGKTEFGPLLRPDILVSSVKEYEKYYGHELVNEEFPTLCKRALQNGAALRINSIKNGAATATKNHTLVFTLSGALGSGHTIKFDPLGGSSYSVTQTWLGSSLATLQAFVNKIIAFYPSNYIKDAKALSGTKMTITPALVDSTTYAVSVSGVSAPTVANSNQDLGVDSAGNVLFSLAPKYGGAYDLVVKILPPSNGKANAFDLWAYIDGLDATKEVYKNLIITDLVIAANQHFLDTIVKNSFLLAVTYQDLSALGNIHTPVANTYSFAGGTMGNALTDNDYIGDQASKTGVFAFDKIEDCSILSILTAASSVVGNSFDNYVSNRGDMVQIIHLDNSIVDVNNLAAARAAFSVDDSYTCFWCSGLRVNNSLVKDATRDISELGDVLAAAAYNDINFGPWYSFSGKNRGKVKSALAIVNDFGNDINLLQVLAINQINTLKKSGNLIHLWHSFTGQSDDGPTSLINIRRMLIDLKRSLKPVIESYIEEPNDIPTWKAMFLEVDPFLKEREKLRAFYYSTIQGLGWFGDQFANSLIQLTQNNIADVRAGNYHATLQIIEIASLQQITLDISLSPSGVNITDNFNQ